MAFFRIIVDAGSVISIVGVRVACHWTCFHFNYLFNAVFIDRRRIFLGSVVLDNFLLIRRVIAAHCIKRPHHIFKRIRIPGSSWCSFGRLLLLIKSFLSLLILQRHYPIQTTFRILAASVVWGRRRVEVDVLRCRLSDRWVEALFAWGAHRQI